MPGVEQVALIQSNPRCAHQALVCRIGRGCTHAGRDHYPVLSVLAVGKKTCTPRCRSPSTTALAVQGFLLKTGTVVDATIIAAPSLTKNETGERDPEMHQTKKRNQWNIDMWPGKRKALELNRTRYQWLEKPEKIKASILDIVE